ncbi:uncharacterized protein si:dkey-21c1.4 [Melanotaenia boesemani]|uniref:uncharacterized protein si:dkey-21c1.4 n=1 Tax=Melanotaenia boesemani TaxID=1250792 RepID=UPI001C047F08|nr:uncharacterized protein si:dkey-21c1.4 [Melanotaenia boesemani]
MSSEVCPFCGKTYKRLQRHLPHCKAAASSKTFPNKEDVNANLTSSSLLAPVLPKTKAKGKKSTQTSSVTTDLHADEGKKVTVSSSELLLSSVKPNAASVSSSTKKKKKLADQIKDATLFLSQSPPLSPTVSKPKKKSLRTLLEAAEFDQKTKGSQGSVTITNSEKVSTKDTSLTHLSADTKPKDAPKKTISKTTKALSTTKTTSNFLDSEVNESKRRPHAKGNLWEDSEGEVEDPVVNKLFSKSGSGQQVKVTLQDVKATLDRSNTRRQSSKVSILSQIEKLRLNSDLSPVSLPVKNQNDAASCLVTPTVLSENLLSTTSQQTEAKSVEKESKQTSLIPLQDDAAPKLKPTFPAAYLPSANSLSQVWQATPGTVSFNKGPKVGHHMAGPLSISPPLHQLSCPLQFPPAQSLPGRAEELQLEVRKQKAAEKLPAEALTQLSVGQVRLRELPEWMACRTPSHPRDVVEMVQRGWRWYYRRYVDVKKAGVGGLGMLLVGYCVISYIWSYPHIKLSRWRKYH